MNRPNGKVEVFYRHYDLPVDFPLVALTGEGWISGPEPVTRLHFHNCMEIGLLLEGSGYVLVENSMAAISAPAVTLIAPNTLHGTAAAEGSKLKWNWFYTNFGRMCSSLSPSVRSEIDDFQQSLSGNCLILSGAEHPEVCRLVELLAGEMRSRGRDYRASARSLLCAAAVMFKRFSPQAAKRCESGSKLMSGLGPAIEYIDAHYAENLRIDALAELCHVSTPHFRRLFKGVFQKSPLEYIEDRRIEHACDLLYNCDYSVTQIGELTGFPSATSFDRQFIRRYGLSPNQWRKKIRNEENPKVTQYLDETEKEQPEEAAAE